MIPEGFVSAPDNMENEMTNIYQMGEIEVGKFRVMFGWRLRAGFIGNDTVELDICCGDKAEAYDDMLKKVCAIIKYNVDKSKDPFYGIPSNSKIKPYFNDEAFCKQINILYNMTKRNNDNENNNNISNNIEDKKMLRAKIFAANFGADMLLIPQDGESKPIFSKVTLNIIENLTGDFADEYPYYKLALIPLSKISNEHAMAAVKIVVRDLDKETLDGMQATCSDDESAKIVFIGDYLKFVIDYSREFFLVSQFAPHRNYSILNIVEVMDYLRDMGYDLGHGNIKSLIAADYAIEKTKFPAQAE